MDSEGTDKLKPSPAEGAEATESKLGDMGQGSREETQGGASVGNSAGDNEKAGRKGSDDASGEAGGRR